MNSLLLKIKEFKEDEKKFNVSGCIDGEKTNR